MFKQLGEKKQQVEKLLKIANAIKDLVVHSEYNSCSCFIDNQFHIFDLKSNGNDSDIEVCINKAIVKMQNEINLRSKEILTSPKGL